MLVVALLLGSPVASAFGGSGESDEPRIVHVVQPGETLWSIAQGHAPARDPREVIYAIVELNGLDDEPLVPGQTLALPDDG
jgi:LysM repeat protein